jgi:hypothetical protein
MTLHLMIPGTANPASPHRHYNTVLEEAHLAGLLVYPENPEAPPPAIVLSRRIGIRLVGLGY